MTQALANTLRTFRIGSQGSGRLYSLPELTKLYPNVKRLPVSLRIVLE